MIQHEAFFFWLAFWYVSAGILVASVASGLR